MDEYRKARRNAVKSIRTLEDYNILMDGIKLSKCDRAIADMVFVDALSYAQISDRTGYSERSIKRKMCHILSLI